MADPKKEAHDRFMERFVLDDLTGIEIDSSQAEGEPFDMSLKDDDDDDASDEEK